MNDSKNTPLKLQKPRKQLLLWMMLLLLTGGVICAGYFFYITQQQYIIRLNNLDTHQRLFATQTTQALDTLKLELSKIHMLNAENTEQQWSLHKAQYAIQLAQLNATWGNNTATTIGLLQQADHFLSQHNNAELFTVRQALAHEIAEAQTTPVLDMPGLLSQLDALQQLISAHSFTKPIILQSNTSPETIAPSPSQNTWHEHLKTTLLSFKQFFVVRHHDSPLEPLMSPAFQTAQKEMIRLNLQEAAWAILERNDTIYQMALKQAHDNIVRAFGTENEQVAHLIKQLKQLQAITLETPAFIPSESLPLLEGILHQMTPAQAGATS